jgi:uncharacterized protein YbaR (Trm112 family)
MRVDLIELLRCPSPHETSPLVTVADRRDGEHLLDASLGCVVCGASYALRDGVLDLSPDGADDAFAGTAWPASTARADDEYDGAVHAVALRLAALLNLTDAASRVLLCGRSLNEAQAVEALADVQVVSLNPFRDDGAVRALLDIVYLSRTNRIPLADRCLSGIAVDAYHASLLADVTRVVRVGGRVLAPAAAPVPDGCRELARDDAEWVAEVVAATSAPVGLTRGR